MEFKDRVANKPNRVKLTYEDSGASSYAIVELADEPIENGTPLNKATFDAMQKELLGFKRELTSSEDLNSLVDDGVYFYTTATVQAGLGNAPFENAAVVMVFGGTSKTTQKIQIAFRYGVAGEGKFRALYSGQWNDWTYFDGTIESAEYPGCYYRIGETEWEWINPPMKPNVEYCTTERVNGRKVYAQLFRLSKDEFGDPTVDGEVSIPIMPDGTYLHKFSAWTDNQVLPYHKTTKNGGQVYREVSATRVGGFVYRQTKTASIPDYLWIEARYYRT